MFTIRQFNYHIIIIISISVKYFFLIIKVIKTQNSLKTIFKHNIKILLKNNMKHKQANISLIALKVTFVLC